jgi:hypothetical protein
MSSGLSNPAIASPDTSPSGLTHPVFKVDRSATSGSLVWSCCFRSPEQSLSTAFRRAVVRPIVDLADTARLVSTERDYSVRVPPTTTRNEVSVLVAAFNDVGGAFGFRTLRPSRGIGRDLNAGFSGVHLG